MNHLFRTLSVLCLLTPMLLHAQEEEPAPEVAVSEHETVWATAVQTSTVQLSEEALMLKQADHLGDLLRPLPGVDVGGAHSLNQRVTIRGLGDRDLDISIDGATQNSYMYHHMGNLQIHADILKSVDIEVGAESVVHGGLGGAVRFETKDAADLLGADQRFGARLRANHADNDGSGYALTAYGRAGRMDYMAYGNWVSRGNFRVGGGEIADETGTLIPGTDGRVRGHEGDVADALFSLGWNPVDGHGLEVALETYEDEGDYSYRPDMGLATDLAIADSLNLPLVYPTRFTRDTLRAEYEALLAGHTRLRAGLYRNDSTLRRDESGVAAVFGGPSEISGLARNDGFRLTGETVSGARHLWNYGAERRDYATRYRADADAPSEERSLAHAIYVEDRFQVNDQLLVVPGVRYDTVDLDAVVSDGRFDRVSGALAVEFRPARPWLLRASARQLFKAPETGEVFLGAGLYDTPNPEIAAEHGRNDTLGLVYEDAVLGAKRLRTGVTVFRTTLEDYIYDYVRTADFNGRANVGDMVLDGFEAFVAYDRGGFQALLSYDHADSDLEAAPGFANLEGARLDRQQGDSLSLALDYGQGGWQVHWDGLHVDGVPAGLNLDGATLDNTKDAYTVHNLSFRWTPERLPRLDLVLAVDNLFDTYYASQSSRTGVSAHPRFGNLYLLDYEPGRNIKAHLGYRF